MSNERLSDGVSDPRMTNPPSAFDTLAEELGIVAARIERGLDLRLATVISTLGRCDAEREVRFAAAVAMLEKRDSEREIRQMQLEQLLKDRMASLKDGIDGAPGPQGEQGPQGPAGVPGEKGDTGASGERGESGERGAPGEQGERGEPGQLGERGEPGQQGAQGERGSTGLTGERGDPGERGEPGAIGPPGERGERGLEGPPGQLPLVEAWVEDSITYKGVVVAHGGGTYQALRDTAKPPGGPDWACLAAPGRDGTDGKSFVVRDTYDPKEKYAALDIVTLNSTWFIAKKDSPGVCPGPDWKSGPVGKRGDRGEKGERGEKGGQGAAAQAPLEWIDWAVDRKAYKIAPILSDGTLGPELPIRELLEQFQSEAL